MLFLRTQYALELLDACEKTGRQNTRTKRQREMVLKQKLVIRYLMLNGLSNMEVANARIEHLDPVDCTLELPRRHWKRNCITNIDTETVRLQIIYSGNRKKGPLLRSQRTRGHLRPCSILDLVKRVAGRTNIPSKEKICPLVLKRTFARMYLGSSVCPHCGKVVPKNTLGGLQKAFGHKHLSSTARYLRYDMDEARERAQEKSRMVRRLSRAKAESVRPLPR